MGKQRTVDERVADLEAKIAAMRGREERKKAKAKPEVRLALQATKALDKALAATQDATLRAAFQEARTTVAAAVAVEGVAVPASTTDASKPKGRGRRVA